MRGSRRPVPTLGPLERDAMEILWASPKACLQVREVAERLDAGLAYTTVMTLLVRLAGKGLLSRRRRGRAFAYRPRLSRSEYVALTMLQTLDDADDQPDALLRFVGELHDDQLAALMRIVGEEST